MIGNIFGMLDLRNAGVGIVGIVQRLGIAARSFRREFKSVVVIGRIDALPRVAQKIGHVGCDLSDRKPLTEQVLHSRIGAVFPQGVSGVLQVLERWLLPKLLVEHF